MLMNCLITSFGIHRLALIIVLLPLICNAIRRYEHGNCKVGESQNTFMNFNVSDTEKDSFLVVKTENVISINVNHESIYAHALFENETLVIKPLAAFETYEKNNNEDDLIALEVDFFCAVGARKTHVFFFRVIDTNNHLPEFVNEAKNNEYMIFTPVGKGFPVIPIYGDLEAADNDLTTNNITFEIVGGNEYFHITLSGKRQNGKKVEYFAKLTTKKVLYELKNPVLLNISITDSDKTNDERKTNHKVITLIGDESYSIPIEEKFEQILYTGIIKKREVLLDNKIKIIAPNDHKNIQFNTSNDYFHVLYKNEDIEIYVKDGICERELYSAPFVFQVNAIQDGKIKAAAVLHLVPSMAIYSSAQAENAIIGLSVVSAVSFLLFLGSLCFYLRIVRKKYIEQKTIQRQKNISYLTKDDKHDNVSQEINRNSTNTNEEDIHTATMSTTSDLSNSEPVLRVALPKDENESEDFFKYKGNSKIQ